MFSKLALASLIAVSAVGGAASTASATAIRPNFPQAIDPIVTGGPAGEKARGAASETRPELQKAQYRDDRRWRDRRHYRDRHWDPRHHHRPPPPRRHYRHGPSVHFGWSAPVYRHVAPRPRIRASSNHVNWCYNRYRSYRASDNTYQPYNGPRRQCYSPYR